MQAISRAGGNVRCRLLLRVRRLWQFQRAEVVIADPFPVLVGVAEGVARAANARAKKARAAKFIMKVSAVLPHELSFGRLVERRRKSRSARRPRPDEDLVRRAEVLRRVNGLVVARLREQERDRAPAPEARLLGLGALARGLCRRTSRHARRPNDGRAGVAACRRSNDGRAPEPRRRARAAEQSATR